MLQGFAGNQFETAELHVKMPINLTKCNDGYKLVKNGPLV